jgi:RND family efflux transporter MFP subunit
MSESTILDKPAEVRTQEPATALPQPDAAPRPMSGKRLLAVGGLAAVVLAVGLVLGVLPRLRQQEALYAGAAEAAGKVPRVTVVVARSGPASIKQVLPGNAAPLLEAAIYARTNGYLTKRLVEIGDHVKEEQLLAEITTPEIDAQLQMAIATLAQGKASLLKDQAKEVLAQADLGRAKALLEKKSIAQQEYDTTLAQAKSATAIVKADLATIEANEADVLRLKTLKAFQKVTAPFPGVITAKNVDPGALVSADSSGTGKELFHLMRIDTLRVFVNVPQVFATDVKVGQTAEVYRKEDALKKLKGTVTRTANALDPGTRTLLTEVQVPNPKNELLPGMYLQVQFQFDRAIAPVLIPGAALATRADGPRVAVLDAQHKVHYRAVQLGRDFGTEVEITAGLSPGEMVVVHPGDDLPEGTLVEPINAPAN